MKFFLMIFLLTTTSFSGANEKQLIGDVAMLNYDEAEKRALNYIDSEFPEIILEDVKVYQISIFHGPKRLLPELNVLFTHKKAFREGPNKKFSNIYFDGVSVKDYNHQEYFTIYFDGNGQPTHHIVDVYPYQGTYEDFLAEFEKI